MLVCMFLIYLAHPDGIVLGIVMLLSMGSLWVIFLSIIVESGIVEKKVVFEYRKGDYGKYEVTNNCDVMVMVFTETSAIVLSDLLNKYQKKIEYQGRVIDKCIREKKRYESILDDNLLLLEEKDFLIGQLNKEKRVLKKIIYELDDEIKYYTGDGGL